MGIFRAAWTALTTAPLSATFATTPDPAPRPIDQLLAEMRGVDGGPVTREQALSVPAVTRGRNLICSVATLPLTQYAPDGSIVRSPLLGQIDPHVANVVTLAQTVEDLICESVAWWQWTRIGYDGMPLNGRRVDPALVSLDPPDGRSASPLPSGVDPRDRQYVWIDGEPVHIRYVCRFDSPNPALLRSGAVAVRRLLLLQRTLAMYATDPRAKGYFTPAEGADPADDDDVKEMLAEWRRARQTGSVGYVPAALKYNTTDDPSPADLQLAELKKDAVLDIANLIGADPEDLGVSTTSRTYANNVDRRRDRVNDVLAPYMRAITDRLSMPDVTPRGHRVAFNLDDYLKSNPTERWSVYRTATDLDVMDAEEIRAAEGLPPRPAPAGPPALRVVPGTGDQVANNAATASTRAARTFDAELRTFDGPPAHGFTVDQGKRTITGLVMPRGAVGRKYGMQYTFAPGALQYSDVSRIKLLRDHDPKTAVGYATSVTETDAGTSASFKVARGAAGDEALALAAEGVLDGLSAGVDFDMSTDTTEGDGGLFTINRAHWREASLTAVPVFDDARVTSVAASRQGGLMHCHKCGGTHAADAACPGGANFTAPGTPTPAPTPTPTPPAPKPSPTPGVAGPGTTTLALSADQLGDLARHVAAQLGQGDDGGRPVVNPHHAPARVADPAPYRFDRRGNLMRGSHDFSQDLFAGWSLGDQAARDRAQTFVTEQFAITPSNVTALNPNRQRPDMYVDQMEYQYPVWESINKGTLTDITPFTFPKFSSSSGLVADHVSGTEPTPGAFTATNQTVTPTPVSGKVEILRETWDQGGNPQVSSLIWRQMTRGYYEALEAFAIAQFVANAASMTDLTITTAAADSTLDQAIASALIPLQYIRGGDRFRTVFTQVDLYTAMIKAKDTAGRRLYPAYGPQNAAGTADAGYAGIDAHGKRWVPAWATAATSINAASSYMFDPDKVFGWASTPQRIDIQWRVAWVDIGLWGYKAFAISDFAGTRELVYDPV